TSVSKLIVVRNQPKTERAPNARATYQVPPRSAKRLECVRLAGALPPPALLPALGKAGASSAHSKRWRAVRESWRKTNLYFASFPSLVSGKSFQKYFHSLRPFPSEISLYEVKPLIPTKSMKTIVSA